MQYNKELFNGSAWLISTIQNPTHTINSSVEKLLQAEDWLVEGERDRSTTLLITEKEKREKSRWGHPTMKSDQVSEKEGVTGSEFCALEAKVNYIC